MAAELPFSKSLKSWRSTSWIKNYARLKLWLHSWFKYNLGVASEDKTWVLNQETALEAKQGLAKDARTKMGVWQPQEGLAKAVRTKMCAQYLCHAGFI